MTKERLLLPHSTKQLGRLLSTGNIPVEEWARGRLEQLQQEILSGESRLIRRDDGELLRNIHIVTINVYFCGETGWYRLCEERSDGLTRASVSEKIRERPWLDYEIRRALTEELQDLTTKYSSAWTRDLEIHFSPEVAFEEERSSLRYAGLNTHYTGYKAATVLPEKYYRPEGYTEKHGRRSTHFRWIPMFQYLIRKHSWFPFP